MNQWLPITQHHPKSQFFWTSQSPELRFGSWWSQCGQHHVRATMEFGGCCVSHDGLMTSWLIVVDRVYEWWFIMVTVINESWLIMNYTGSWCLIDAWSNLGFVWIWREHPWNVMKRVGDPCDSGVSYVWHTNEAVDSPTSSHFPRNEKTKQLRHVQKRSQSNFWSVNIIFLFKNI